MKKLFLSVTAVALAGSVFAADNNIDDKVLMKVNGKDIKVSEFKYLYEKNNAQQLAPQSIDDYVGMFVDYKLKVADAEKAGIDTTASFLSEYTKFRDELAAPYLREQKVEDALLKEAYDHLKRDVKVSHIMLNRNGANSEAVLDSIRTAIIKGEVTFEDAASRYSIDSPTAVNGGLMGWLPAGRFPWAFEKAAYDTKVGGISPVINSGFGYHIVKVMDSRPSKGQVHAAHILKMTRDMPEDAVAMQKAAIDSIYNVLKNGADFAVVATAESQDPGSARNGGDLGWFGSGVMVAPFDSIAFATPDGEISEPFATPFGYHIIKRFAHRDIEPFDEAREKLLSAMARDGRADEPRKEYLKRVGEKYNYTKLMANAMALRYRIRNAPLDSVTLAAIAVDATPLGRMDGGEITVADAFAALKQTSYPNGATLVAAIEQSADALVEKMLTERAIADLAAENADYRNLINEYRDGILLFEISNRNVWDRASQDREGLEAFFHKNAAKYAWDVPRFKGYIIFAANDSTVNAALKYAETLSVENPEEFVAQMRKEFGKDIKIERVIAAKGENPITDYLAFGGEKPEAKTPRWSSYATCRGRVINQPEEAADARGAATTDYQALLEKEWLDKLHKTYPVKIDKKVLKEIKNSTK
ncbi:MAG: peptidylprolyl isomerase [Muribaculaceae bacterium]|nr:peptidylprolyl isomerase [Muribaculaceae bacterium]